jgi:hypothetical protein
MAGAIEVRASGEKFRFVVVNRNGDKLLQSAPFDDKASAKRAATSLVKAVTGAAIVDATRPAAPAAKAKPAPKPAAKAAPKPAAKTAARRPARKR